MKLRKTTKLTKATEYWDLHEGLPGVTLRVTKEGSKIKKIILTGEGPHKTHPMLVTKEFLEFIKKENPWAEIDHKWGWENAELDLKKVYSGNLEFSPEQLIYPYHSGHVLFDHKGEIMEMVELYTYIGTPFHNKACHIKDMLEHLKKSPYVLHDKDDELIIDDVPYYNNESGDQKYIRGKDSGIIRILMPLEIRKEIYQRALIVNPDCFSCAIKELTVSGAIYNWAREDEKDYLGIKQFAKKKKELY